MFVRYLSFKGFLIGLCKNEAATENIRELRVPKADVVRSRGFKGGEEVTDVEVTTNRVGVAVGVMIDATGLDERANILSVQ